MVILGIEAAAKVAGACLYEDGRILAECRTNAGLTHSETLLPMIDEVIKNSGRTVGDIDYVALTNGPGSFTGLRIAAACAKGLALGNPNIKLVPLCTLDSLAYGAGISSGIAVTIMDARRGQVYGAAYIDSKRAVEPQAVAVTELIEQIRVIYPNGNGKLLLLGDAAELYYGKFAEAFGEENVIVAPPMQRETSAASTACLAGKLLEEGFEAINGDELRINYIRLSQAEREGSSKRKWDLIHG